MSVITFRACVDEDGNLVLPVSELAPGSEVEVVDESNRVDLKEIYSLGRIHPQPLQRPGVADIDAGVV